VLKQHAAEIQYERRIGSLGEALADGSLRSAERSELQQTFGSIEGRVDHGLSLLAAVCGGYKDLLRA